MTIHYSPLLPIRSNPLTTSATSLWFHINYNNPLITNAISRDLDPRSDVHWTLHTSIPTQFSSVQFSHSIMSDSFETPWIVARQASLSITNSWSLLKLMSIKSVMPSNHLILCRPLLLLPPIPSSIKVFSNESTLCMRWPKYWSFRFSISPFNEYPGLISFNMNWLDLLAVYSH